MGPPPSQQQQNSLWPAADLEASATEALVAGKEQDQSCFATAIQGPPAPATTQQQQQDHAAGPTAAAWHLHRLVWSSGVCCVLLAAFIFSVAAVLVKLTAGRVPVLEITLIRSSISLVVSAALIKAKGIKPVLGHSHNIKWLIPRGIFGATAMTTFYAAILLLPLADGMTLFFLNPCLTAVAAWALRGEPLGLLGFAGCGISLLGMVVLVHPPMIFGGHAQWGPRRVWGTGFGLFSAICCAGAFISIRYIGKSEPAIVVALYFHCSTAVLSALPLAFSWPQTWQPLSLFDASMLVGVAAGSFLGQLFMTRGMQLENASLASSLNYSQVLYSYIFGIFFFQEHLSVFGILGSLLVALGIACVTKRPKDPAAADSAAADPSTGPSLVSLVSISERARRLDSFKRLLSRNRAASAIADAADADAVPDAPAGPEGLGTEGLPLMGSGSVMSSKGSLSTQQHSSGPPGSKQQQHQQGLQQGQWAEGGSDVQYQSLDQNAGTTWGSALPQQQQRHEQVVLGPVLHHPIEVHEVAYGLHHRGTYGASSSSDTLPAAAAGQQHQQQYRQQLHALMQHGSGDAVLLAPLQPEPAAGTHVHPSQLGSGQHSQ